MDQEKTTLSEWIKSLPASDTVYPKSIIDKIKYHVWRLYTPYHSSVRDALLAMGFVHHKGRQHYLLGKVSPHLTIKEFTTSLINKGYGNHFIAWKDDGELLGLRCVDGFERQYHIRVFEDGEVRGHYEYTPESHPILHIKEVGAEDRSDTFLNHLGDTIVRNS